MSQKRGIDPRPAKVSLWGWGPLAPEGTTRRDDEHTRFHTLAHSGANLRLPDGTVIQEGPYLSNGVTRYRPLVIRCAGKCGAIVGQVWLVDKERQGKPFTWVDVAWITDRSSTPPLVTVFCMILDNYSAGFTVEAECARHGVVTVPVAEVVAALPRGMEQLQRARTSLTVLACPAP